MRCRPGYLEIARSVRSLACNARRTDTYVYVCIYTYVLCTQAYICPTRGRGFSRSTARPTRARDIVGGFCDLRDDCHVCRERTLARDSPPRVPRSRDTLSLSTLSPSMRSRHLRHRASFRPLVRMQHQSPSCLPPYTPCTRQLASPFCPLFLRAPALA